LKKNVENGTSWQKAQMKKVERQKRQK